MTPLDSQGASPHGVAEPLSLEAVSAQYKQLLQRLEANEREFRRLGRAVWRVQEDERRRLARELHDGLGQNLTALMHRLSQLATGLDGDERIQLDAAIALCAETLEDTRHLSRLLRPPILDDLGLVAALRWLARNQAESAGIEVTAEIVEPLPPMDSDLQTLLFRVAQESLTNVARHSGARTALLRLVARDGTLRLQVADDGRGCDPVAAEQAGGSGLGGMRERLRLYDGRLELHSLPGDGMRVRVVVPLASA